MKVRYSLLYYVLPSLLCTLAITAMAYKYHHKININTNKHTFASGLAL